MHTQVRRFIKTGIVFLLLGLVLGGWMLVERELYHHYPSTYLLSAHTHLIAVGFVMQMILGVALWLFPRPASDDTRYRPTLITVSWWCVTVGTASRAIGELLRPFDTSGTLGWFIVFSGAAQLVGLMVFFYTMWTRIRAVGSKIREAQGERF